MTDFSVLILGSSSATPTSDRHLSAQVVSVHDKLFLIDCGEWTQMQLKKYKIRHQRINHIFISHLHGDHYLGLAGLMFTMHLFGRKSALHVYANPELENILSLQLKVSDTVLLYPLIFHPLEPGSYGKIYEDEGLEVKAFPLLHGVPTHGFIFSEKQRKRKIIKESVIHLDIPSSAFEKIKNGEDLFMPDGRIIPNEDLTTAPDRPRSFAYCSDTGFTEDYVKFIQGVDMLYHEATFMQEKESNARDKMHSTTLDAATIAKQSGVKKLLLGHYSARYDDLQPLLDETRTVFSNSFLTEDGLKFYVE